MTSLCHQAEEVLFRFLHLLSILVCFLVSVINIMIKEQLGEERVYPTYASWSQSIIEGRNSIWELEAETTEECCLLALVSGLLSCLVYTTQAHLPKDGLTRSGVGHPKSFSKQENVL